jgi:hypothetical protein
MNFSARQKLCSFAGKCLLALLLLTTQLACTATTLPPYEATYTTKLRGIKISGTRTFEQIGENRYRISWQAKALWMRLNEWSEFEIANNKVRPLSYHYTRKGLGTDRPIHVYFDWQNMQVSGSKGKKRRTFALQEGVQDKLSYQVQMQLDLLAQPELRAVDYQVATHSSIKHYVFNFQRQETLDTVLGDRDSLLFERQKNNASIKIWLAATHYYSPIKVLQVDEDGSSNSLIIRSWKSKAKPYSQIASLTQDDSTNIPSAPQKSLQPVDDDF